MPPPIYLDHHATTPLDPRALDAMLPYLRERFGNAASSSHRFGWEASQAIESARAEVARLAGARPDEVVFTSGATEGDNLVLLGVLDAARRAGRRGAHVIVGATEHVAVLDPARHLEEEGVRVTRLPVDRFGQVDPDDLRRALEPGTVLASFMTANNEIGTLHPVAEIGSILRAREVAFHSDAAQAAGRVALGSDSERPDFVSLSAHKLYGPKGVGAVIVRGGAGAALRPRSFGGGHERGLRPGTPNVPGIVGFGAAAALAADGLAAEAKRIGALRDRLLSLLRESLDGVELNGHPVERLEANLHLSFGGVDGEALVASLAHEIALSTGSACASASPSPSHVLRAIGLSPERASGSIRIGLGRFNTEAEIERAGARIAEEVVRLRAVGGG